TPATTNITKVTALVYGDRIELRSMAGSRLAPPIVIGFQGGPQATNATSGQQAAFASSSAGTAGSLTTFVAASRNTFLDSTSLARKSCSISGTLQVGDWVQLTVSKVNGTVIKAGATNQSLSGTPYILASNLFYAINS